MAEKGVTRVATAERATDDSFEDFVGTISRCAKQIQRIKAARAAEWGLRGTDVMALYYLERNPEGVTSSDLARLVGVDRAAISRTISGLMGKGLVESGAHGSAGGRSYRAPLLLTGRGRDAARSLDSAIDEVVARAAEGVAAADREAMYRTLDVILTNLTAIAESEER